MSETPGHMKATSPKEEKHFMQARAVHLGFIFNFSTNHDTMKVYTARIYDLTLPIVDATKLITVTIVKDVDEADTNVGAKLSHTTRIVAIHVQLQYKGTH